MSELPAAQPHLSSAQESALAMLARRSREVKRLTDSANQIARRLNSMSGLDRADVEQLLLQLDDIRHSVARIASALVPDAAPSPAATPKATPAPAPAATPTATHGLSPAALAAVEHAMRETTPPRKPSQAKGI